MSNDGEGEATGPVPARWSRALDAAARPRSSALREVVRDGSSWPVGTAADVAWIPAGTTVDRTITSAIPPVFDAHATVGLPEAVEDQSRHDQALLSVLGRYSVGRAWWLGYLDTSADDVVFPEAPRVSLYSSWPYVLVQAGPEQAATWRGGDLGASFWSGRLPNLMFPADRRWLVSTLWDDDWTCVGGPVALMGDLLDHPELKSLTRRIELGQEVGRPGDQAT